MLCKAMFIPRDEHFVFAAAKCRLSKEQQKNQNLAAATLQGLKQSKGAVQRIRAATLVLSVTREKAFGENNPSPS
ncbi:MAG: hypothetical protein RSE36_07365, partial [Oscillospiraceae bacterium]